MSSGATVSVVLPTHDRAETLPRAIDSALDQDLDDVAGVDSLEVVVVDDGSRDRTAGVVAEYDSAPVRYVYQDNAGANAARNRGIEAATGEYVSFLDSDDELLPGHLAASVEAIRTSPARCRGAVTGDARVENGRVLKVKRPATSGATCPPDSWRAEPGMHPRVPVQTRRAPETTARAPETTARAPGHATESAELVTLADARDRNPVGGFSSTTFECGAFDHVGRLDESMPAAQDYEFFLRYLGAFDLVAVDRVLVRSHVEADSISVDPDRKRRGNEALLERHGDVLSAERRARQRFAAGLAAAQAGEMADARAAFRTCIRLRTGEPTSLGCYLAALGGERTFGVCYHLATWVRALCHRARLGTGAWPAVGPVAGVNDPTGTLDRLRSGAWDRIGHRLWR